MMTSCSNTSQYVHVQSERRLNLEQPLINVKKSRPKNQGFVGFPGSVGRAALRKKRIKVIVCHRHTLFANDEKGSAAQHVSGLAFTAFTSFTTISFGFIGFSFRFGSPSFGFGIFGILSSTFLSREVTPRPLRQAVKSFAKHRILWLCRSLGFTW